MKWIRRRLYWLRIRPNVWVHHMTGIVCVIALIWIGVSISFGSYYDDSVVGSWIHRMVTGRSDSWILSAWPPCYAVEIDGKLWIVDGDTQWTEEFLSEYQDHMLVYTQGENRSGFLAPVRVQTVHSLMTETEWEEFDPSLGDSLMWLWDWGSVPDQVGFLAIGSTLLQPPSFGLDNPYYEPFRVYWAGHVMNVLALVAFCGFVWSAWWAPAMIREQAAQIRSRIGRRRIARGICPECRYDVRATPGRCPECGWGHADEVDEHARET
ncbi:MAG: hypothetical protein IID31_13810 [Planctomycetes bacterium]|nr:hypothetical protein [Planctomycetota bacterium]